MTGDQAKGSGVAEHSYQDFIRMCITKGRTMSDVQTESFDASEGISVASIQVEHSVEWDKAMETWAQAELGIVRVRHLDLRNTFPLPLK